MTGYTAGELDSNTNSASEDYFIVKYNSSGTKQWTKQDGNSFGVNAQGVATDSSGNVYVTGRTYGLLYGNTYAGMNDLFVVKYNSSGTMQWTKTYGSNHGDIARGGVATDSSGNAYVAGYTKGGLDSNTLAGTANDDEDYFIVKFDSNGNKQ